MRSLKQECAQFDQFGAISRSFVRAASGRLTVAAVATVLCVGDGRVGSGEAYRFASGYTRGARQLVPQAADAVRWSPDIWPEGGTLVWHALDHLKWAPAFTDTEAVLPLLQKALDAWAAIPTADVRWRMDGVIPGESAVASCA